MCERKSYAVWFSCRRMRKSYPVWCEDLSNLWLFTLEIGMTRHSLATSQKSPQSHRSCVWIEALSYPVWLSWRRMRKRYPVWCEDLSNLWLFTLEIGMTRHSLATSQKSPQSHRSCVWIEALSYPVWLSWRRMRKRYPVWCEDLSNLWLFTLEIGMTRHSLATSQKSPQSHRSCVWIEALSYPVWFSKRRKSYPL